MSNRILSYKGLIADATQDTILLTTKKGEVGYKIVKFQLMGITENTDYETTVQIWKEDQAAAITDEVDFSDNRLLAAGLYGDTTSGSDQSSQVIFFDQEIFNQDIYVTHKATTGSTAINYYLELEVIKLDESQAMVATLKDIRNNS